MSFQESSIQVRSRTEHAAKAAVAAAVVLTAALLYGAWETRQVDERTGLINGGQKGGWELPVGPGEKPVYLSNLGDYVQTTREGWVEVPPGSAPFTRFCFTKCFSEESLGPVKIWPFSR